MPRRTPRPHQRRGAKGLLTPHLHNNIVELVQAGNYLSTAASTNHISERTLHSWLQRGYQAQENIDNNQPTNPKDHRYLQFMLDVTRARARAEANAVGVVQKVMEGGYLVSEEPMLNAEGFPVFDQDGEPLMKREYAKPDGKLALAYLAVTSRQRFGPAGTQVELINGASSPGLASDGESDSDAEEELARRVRANAAARMAEIEAGEVVDAQVID